MKDEMDEYREKWLRKNAEKGIDGNRRKGDYIPPKMVALDWLQISLLLGAAALVLFGCVHFK